MSAPQSPLPLPALLSHVLVAFAVELDNEFEHRMPHRTARFGGTGFGPWLASVAMWFTCMRFVDEKGVSVRELERLARMPTNLDGMRRWGYVTIAPDRSIFATPKGLLARAAWAPLCGAIEARWQERFGEEQVERLRQSLRTVARQLNGGLPDYMPILGYAFFTRERVRLAPPADDAPLDTLPLVSLLARLLIAFALEFEQDWELSLAICSNVLRVLNEEGVRVRDLLRLSGVSKEAIAMAVKYLAKQRYVAIAADPAAARTKVARLTPRGRAALDAYRDRLAAIEAGWEKRFGAGTIRGLRRALGGFAGGPVAEPYPECWRAKVPAPETLPHYPMVLHRGGYPDGA